MQPTLHVNLGAIAENYKRLSTQFSGKQVSAVVKADAYGLGAREVSKRLMKEGCTLLFVATLEEALLLKQQLTEDHITLPQIGVFHGPFTGEEKTFIEHGFVPAINDLAQLERWLVCTSSADKSPYILHVDTGMTRLGLSASDLSRFTDRADELTQQQPLYIMSHLACAEDNKHPKNAEQLTRFSEACALLNSIPTSFCNSSGIYLDQAFHGHMARPGSALYGINPATYLGENPMQHVADLTAPIITIRTLDRAETIGYGATKDMPKGSHVAIVQMGYADGYLRYLSNKGYVYIAGIACPVLGRVSMDMIAVDVSHIAEQKLSEHHEAKIICDQQRVDAVAEQAGTIGYEIFTSLSNRVKRVYS